MPINAPPTPTSDWNLLNDKFYRKQQITQTSSEPLLNGDLSRYMMSVGKNGGPIGRIEEYICCIYRFVEIEYF